MNEATRNYVRQHADDDVSLLALRGSKDPLVDLPFALQQIQGRQTARRKLPSWAGNEGIVYPPHLNMEQCSSEPAARYKARLCERLLAQLPQCQRAAIQSQRPSSLIDLTGGLGVDFAFMQQAFAKATYVELNPQLFAIACQNFQALGIAPATVNADGMAYFSTADHATLTYLDPARRDIHGQRTYGIADCTPDVLQHLPMLLERSTYVLLKLSPMLDWHKAVSDLGEENVSEVHIVAVHNECKELLVLLHHNSDETAVFCVNDDQVFQPSVANAVASLPPCPFPAAGMYLYEPNAAVMKAGCFDALSAQFRTPQIARDSHLFLSEAPAPQFPGRQFQISAVSSLNKHDLRAALKGITRANVATRHFPLTPQDLRRRLKLADGGDTYIFATTIASAEHLLLICKRI